MNIAKLEALPDYKGSVQSIYKTLGRSYNKHDSITTLSRHLPKHKRWFCKLVVKAFVKEGLLRHHRSNTYSWTERGLRYAEAYLSPPSGAMERAVLVLLEGGNVLSRLPAVVIGITPPSPTIF